MKAAAVVIDWFGPYTLDEAEEASRDFHHGGAYMAIGKCSYERGREMQYCGISSGDLQTRLGKNHLKLHLITRERTIWLGDVATAQFPGPKKWKTNTLLSLAEWAFVFGLQLPLNDKKKTCPPPSGITVLSRWWSADYNARLTRRPHTHWPRVIDYPGPGYECEAID